MISRMNCRPHPTLAEPGEVVENINYNVRSQQIRSELSNQYQSSDAPWMMSTISITISSIYLFGFSIFFPLQIDKTHSFLQVKDVEIANEDKSLGAEHLNWYTISFTMRIPKCRWMEVNGICIESYMDIGRILSRRYSFDGIPYNSKMRAKSVNSSVDFGRCAWILFFYEVVKRGTMKQQAERLDSLNRNP